MASSEQQEASKFLRPPVRLRLRLHIQIRVQGSGGTFWTWGSEASEPSGAEEEGGVGGASPCRRAHLRGLTLSRFCPEDPCPLETRSLCSAAWRRPGSSRPVGSTGHQLGSSSCSSLSPCLCTHHRRHCSAPSLSVSVFLSGAFMEEREGAGASI